MNHQNNFVFECDECVVCLEDGVRPDALFAPCRHRCCCTVCAQLVEKARQPCPLCRVPIADVYYYKDHAAAADHIVPVDATVVAAFKAERRDEYVKRLKAPVTGDACFRGKGKLARSVASAVGSEMEQRQRETAGTERVMAKQSTIVYREDVPAASLVVDYKVGRAKRCEDYPLMTLQEARDGLVECLGGDKVSALDVATHYPDFYWNLRYRLRDEGPSLSDYLEQELGVLTKRR